MLAFTLATLAVLQKAPVVPLAGDWQLDLARTHYGPGVDRRRSERFTCHSDGTRLSCVIRSVRANGEELTARFVAPLDGTLAPVRGIPDVDRVRFRRPSDALLHATFFSRGKPVFGYRAYQSDDGRSLMIVSVDPVSRAAPVAMVNGPAAGLARIESLRHDDRLRGGHRLDAVRAHLLERAGERDTAIEAFRAAAAQTSSAPEQQYLLMKAARLK